MSSRESEIISTLLPDIKEVCTCLRPNPETPYKREILKVEPLLPERCRIVFHTAAENYPVVDPSKCRSSDFVIKGEPLQVSYVLPYPHVNRVRDVSDIFSATRIEAQKKHGYSHSYLTIADREEDLPCAQIRLGSTLKGAYLLALENVRGSVFEVIMRAEGGIHYVEHISLSPLKKLNLF